MHHFLKLTTLLGLATGALATWQSLGIPSSHSGSTISVKAFNVGNLTIGGYHTVVHPVLPGRDTATLPMYAFLLEHTTTQTSGPRTGTRTPVTRRFMWDLGIRKDPQNSVPSIAAIVAAFPDALDEPKDITELLVDGGVDLTSIEAVIWSHAHIDHFGDMSKFPNSTGLVIGGATDTSVFPANPNATLQASDFAGHNLTKIDFTTSKLIIANMPAVDFFGDGSFYLLDTPGHVAGHMTGLVRVTASPPSFILLAGDTAHHIGAARPRPLLQAHFPCPGDILSASRTAVSTDAFWSPHSSLGEFDLPSRTQSMLALSDTPDGLYVDPTVAQVSLEKVSQFDADEDVYLVIAHDASLVGALPVFPQSLNGWKNSGLKEKTVWRFLQEDNLAFLFSPVPANATV
ncbi:hypothetical protein C8F01DRAFT_1254199 [Mycena amicta]|nr:hypothetical protein C8F01DRAFT_1254199 [Mycena amicta]